MTVKRKAVNELIADLEKTVVGFQRTGLRKAMRKLFRGGADDCRLGLRPVGFVLVKDERGFPIVRLYETDVIGRELTNERLTKIVQFWFAVDCESGFTELVIVDEFGQQQLVTDASLAGLWFRIEEDLRPSGLPERELWYRRQMVAESMGIRLPAEMLGDYVDKDGVVDPHPSYEEARLRLFQTVGDPFSKKREFSIESISK